MAENAEKVVASRDDLNVGDIVYQTLDRNDGLTLTKDSRLDCAVLFPMKARKSVAVKAKVVGHLTEADVKAVLPLVASCGFIDEHVRKVFRLNTYLQSVGDK